MKKGRRRVGIQISALPHPDRKAFGVLLVAPRSRKKLPWWPDVEWVAMTWAKNGGVTGWTIPAKAEGMFLVEDATKIKLGAVDASVLVEQLILDWEDLYDTAWKYALGLCQPTLSIEVG